MDSIELTKLPASHTQHKTQKIWLFFLKELLEVLICSHVLPQVSWKNKIIKLYAIQSLAFSIYTLQHKINNCSRNKGFCVCTVPLKNKLPVESCFLCDENPVSCCAILVTCYGNCVARESLNWKFLVINDTSSEKPTKRRRRLRKMGIRFGIKFFQEAFF